MNRPWTRMLLGSLAALALASGACSKKESEPEPQPQQGQAQEQPREHSTLLAEGAAAPDFSTVAHDGTTVSIKALAGQPVVLFFYPKDATPG